MSRKYKIPSLILAIIWTFGLVGFYYWRFPLRLMSHFEGFGSQMCGVNFGHILINFAHFGAGLILLISAYGAGRFLIELVAKNSQLERELPVPFVCLVGFFILGMAIFFLGVFGALHRGIVVALVIIFAALFFRYKINFQGISLPKDWSRRILWGVFAILALVCFVYALTPPIQSDGLRYHLAAPQEYLKQRRIFFIPLSAFSNFPFLIEMLFMAGMMLTGDLLAHLLHWIFWLLCAGIIHAFVGRFWLDDFKKSSPAPLMAGLAFASIPAVSILACWAFIDAALAAYFIGFIYIFCLYLETRRSRLVILCGAMGGALMGIKYTMLPLVLFGCLLLLILEYFHDKKTCLRSPLLMGIIALTCALPWYLKNLILTGNPVYPLAYNIFGGRGWSAANAAFYASKAADKGLGATPLSFLLSPWNATFRWNLFESFNPGIFPLYAAPFLIISPLLLKTRQRRETWLTLLCFAGVYYIMWFWGYQSNRFLIPFYGLAALIIARLFIELKAQDKWVARVFAAGLFICILYGVLWSVRWILTEARPHPLPAFLGAQTREDYLEAALDYYPAIRAVNADIPAEQTILCIGEHRAYYFKPRLIISDWFDTPAILDLIRKTRSNAEIFEILQKQNCRHIFFNKGELSKYHNPYFRPRFSDDEYRRFVEFMESSRLVLKSKIGEVYIYRINEK